MALKGNLRDFTITQLLNLINLARKTGTLVIEGPSEAARIAFRDGKLSYAQYGQEDTGLASILARNNKISQSQYRILKERTAQMTDKELETYFNSNDMIAYTTNTITNLNQLKTHLLTIVNEGVAFDDEEFKFGTRNVAAGIKDVEGRFIASIGVLAPSVRLTRAKMVEIAPEVKRCAVEISKVLGYKG